MCWMNFVPVCARILWVLAAELAIFLLLWLLYGLDEELRIYTRRSWLMLGSVLTAICAFCMYPTKAEGVPDSCGFWLMSVYLGISTTMDIFIKQVSDILHYFGLAGALLLIGTNMPNAKILWELIFYMIIQYLVFAKMYGRADVATFMICAIFVSATGRGMEAFVSHLVIAFGLLALIQAFRRNIASDGNLKHPVALFPYIICAFFMII